MIYDLRVRYDVHIISVHVIIHHLRGELRYLPRKRNKAQASAANLTVLGPCCSQWKWLLREPSWPLTWNPQMNLPINTCIHCAYQTERKKTKHMWSQLLNMFTMKSFSLVSVVPVKAAIFQGFNNTEWHSDWKPAFIRNSCSQLASCGDGCPGYLQLVSSKSHRVISLSRE